MSGTKFPNAVAAKSAAYANGIRDAPSKPIARAPSAISGTKLPSNAAATPSVINAAAITPMVPSPTSFIKLSENASGTIAAPSAKTANEPLSIAPVDLLNIFASKTNPVIAIRPLPICLKSTPLNCFNPIASSPTEPPNSAIETAPLRTLLSPNFLTPSAILFRNPPLLLPLEGMIDLSAVFGSAFAIAPSFSPFLPPSIPERNPLPLDFFLDLSADSSPLLKTLVIPSSAGPNFSLNFFTGLPMNSPIPLITSPNAFTFLVKVSAIPSKSIPISSSSPSLNLVIPLKSVVFSNCVL